MYLIKSESASFIPQLRNLGGKLSSKITFVVLAAIGKAMQTAEYNDTDQVDIDLTNSKQGIYFCKIVHDGTMVMNKLI